MDYQFEFLLVDVREGVATVTLNRPKLNPLNNKLFLEIGECATRLQSDEEVRSVVVTGGEKVFAAGADIKEMLHATPAEITRIISGAQDSLTRLENVPKPVIAAINGYALGGGCELALACDWRFAHADAQIGLPEILLGIIPGAGGTQRLSRLVGAAKAKELIFSGCHQSILDPAAEERLRFYTARECLEFGLVDRVVQGDGAAVIAEAQAVARKFATRYPPFALAMAKRAINNGLNCSMTDGLAIEAQGIALCFSTEDQSIGMKSFVEKGAGKAEFTGR